MCGVLIECEQPRTKETSLLETKSHGCPPCMFEALCSFESFDEMYDPTLRIISVSQSDCFFSTMF